MALARISHTGSSREAGEPHADKERAAEGAGLGEYTLFKPEASATKTGWGAAHHSGKGMRNPQFPAASLTLIRAAVTRPESSIAWSS